MRRRLLLSLFALPFVIAAVPGRATAQPSSLDTARAKDFLGEWVLTTEGPRGTQERPLSITDAGGKLVATLIGGRGGTRTITDITMNGASLVLKWKQQTPQGDFDAVLTLTRKDGGLTVTQDIAGGQVTMTGTGRKKS